MRTVDLITFMRAREDVRERREQGFPKPWTENKLLQRFRFCNVHREDDTVTRWIAQHWRDLNATHVHLPFAMLVARLFNWPPTLTEIGFPIPFDPKKMLRVVRNRQDAGEKTFSSAYIVSTNGATVRKVDYLVESVLTPAWAARGTYRMFDGMPLAQLCANLRRLKGVAGFIAGQVVADCKYTPLLASSEDWYSFAVRGPGSRRGMNRVLARLTNAPISESEWHAHLMVLLADVQKEFPGLHAQDLQNCLCEFDKYERVRIGEGRPRQRYSGV